MASHGTVPVLACALRGVSRRVGGARAGLAWCAARGVRRVMLDATDRELRPRTLDRSARRDLAALLRRHELETTGIDLLVPAEHFEDGALVDRALSAAVAAVGLVSELASLGACGPDPAVCVAVGAQTDEAVLESLSSAGERGGVRVVLLTPMEGVSPIALELGPMVRAGVDGAGRIAALGTRVGLVRVDRFDRSTLSAVPGCVAALSVVSPGAIGVADLTDSADPSRAWEACAAAWRGPTVSG